MVHILSQFVSATSTHYATLLRVLRYLRGTMTRSLLFPSDSPFTLRAYSNAGWANDLNTRRSTAGFCVFFRGSSLILRVACVKTLLPGLLMRLSIKNG